MLKGKLIYIFILFSFVAFGQQKSKMLLASIQQAGGGGDDSILSLSPVVYYTPSSIQSTGGDGDTVTAWNDTSGNGFHATPSSGTATLNVGSTGNQVEFDGSVWFDVTDDASLDFDICTDAFTLIAREGDVASTTSGYAVSKAEATASDREYGIYYTNSTTMGIYLGGSVANATITAADNKLHIYIVNGNAYEYYIDGVLESSGTLSGCSDGSGSQSVNIGSRTDGAYVMNSGSHLDMVAIIPTNINGTQRAAIETEFQVN